MSFHPDYGLPTEYRLRVLATLSYFTVREAAEHFRLHPSTIYAWRKRLEDA